MHNGKAFAAFLFDMDGTILTSIASAERVWTEWARGHGVDPITFLPTIHGVRAVETIARLGLPGVDPEVEALVVMEAEIADLDGIAPISGAPEFLATLPPDRWAIVTSAPKVLALHRLKAAGLSAPAVFITADDVTRGKPFPEPFLLAAERLGVSAGDCLVFEDAPAGIAAAEAAGASLVVITETHGRTLVTHHPTVRDYSSLQIVLTEDAVRPLSLT